MYKWEMKPIFKKFIGEVLAQKYVGSYKCKRIAQDAYCKFLRLKNGLIEILDEEDMKKYESYTNNLEFFLYLGDEELHQNHLIYAIQWYDEMLLKYKLKINK